MSGQSLEKKERERKKKRIEVGPAEAMMEPGLNEAEPTGDRRVTGWSTHAACCIVVAMNARIGIGRGALPALHCHVHRPALLLANALLARARWAGHA